MNLARRIATRLTERRYSLNNYADWVNQFMFQGLSYGPGIQQTLQGDGEAIEHNFGEYVTAAYQRNGVVFACQVARSLIFTEARFAFQTMRGANAGALRDGPGLRVLDTPWPGGHTGDLLSRMLQDADLAGNAYMRVTPPDSPTLDPQIERLRPDWIVIVTYRLPEMHTPARLGYLYWPDGPSGDRDPVPIAMSEVAHWRPIPDPLATYRGMSWLTPVVRETISDSAATTHKIKFFEQGAPQPLDARVLTPSGWTTMGALSVGDHVVGRDGKGHEITAVYPQGEQDIYRVTFTNGTSTECTLDHLWTVHRGAHHMSYTMPLREIVDRGLHYPSGAAVWSVDFVDPVEFEDADDVLPLDSYLLGLLIGDGYLNRTPSLSAHADDLDETLRYVHASLPVGCDTSTRVRGNCAEINLVDNVGYHGNVVADLLRSIGLYGCVANDKFIPAAYKTAPVADRLRLLQGIVDSDGSIERRQPSEVRVTTVSRTLADDLVDLVGSLGGIASVRQRIRDRDVQTQYVVNIRRLPAWITPARLRRKANLYQAHTRVLRRRYIASVELVRRAPAQCIAVDSSDNLYVTDDYILTHNSPSMVVSYDPQFTYENFLRLKKVIDTEYTGAQNAYKVMHLAGGADVTVVGSNMEEMDYKNISGLSETRIAAAARVPPIIVGLSEGLAASTYSNHAQARRHFADSWARPYWHSACNALSSIIDVPNGSRLWYDARDISFLQEDEDAAAEIFSTKVSTVVGAVNGGFTAESAIAAVDNQDLTLLEHTGLVSVQMQPPGEGIDDDEPDGSSSGDGSDNETDDETDDENDEGDGS